MPYWPVLFSWRSTVRAWSARTQSESVHAIAEERIIQDAHPVDIPKEISGIWSVCNLATLVASVNVAHDDSRT